MKPLTEFQRIVNLVENFPEHQHRLYPESLGEIMDKLKEKGYKTENHIYCLYVSKNDHYIDNIGYYGRLPERISINVDFINNKIQRSSNPIAYSTSLTEAFQDYDETCRVLPEIWTRLILALYGEAIPVSVKYTFNVLIQTTRSSEEIPMEMNVEKLT